MPVNRGFTLLEVLITVALLAVGLLGLAALQAYSLQSNQGATLRTEANLIAADVFEQLLSGTIESDNDGVNTATTYCNAGIGMAVLPQGQCDVRNCGGSSSGVAAPATFFDNDADDYNECTNIDEYCRNCTASGCTDPQPPAVRILLSWQERADRGDTGGTRLSCVELQGKLLEDS